jgi:DNA-binding MarR family transcriptional regulator
MHLLIICRRLSSVNVPSREDLGSQFARITRRLIALERPLLDRHGVTMWEYVVLLRLRSAAAETQMQLAQAIHYDKTRLIALLDTLEQRGLVTREQGAEDRRARTVKLTRAGRAKVGAVQRDIHRMEDALLTPEQLHSLQRLLVEL